MAEESYETLVREAVEAHRDGWDFSWLDSRAHGPSTSWSYTDLAREAVAGATSLLDVDTGGGELLASLAPLPATTVATESWPPNVPVATQRLAPLGVRVIAVSGGELPWDVGAFDLVLNRHGRLVPAAARRVLRLGGRLLTQQVGSDDCEELNALLGAGAGHRPGSWTMAIATRELEDAGFTIVSAREEHPEFVFDDVGAIVFQLQMVAWQIPDFDPRTYDSGLRELHRRIMATGPVTVRAHRFLIDAIAG